MARDFPATFTAQSPIEYSHNRDIKALTETTIGENLNYLAAKKLVPIVSDAWAGGAVSATAGDGSTFYVLASWRRKVQADFGRYTCTVRTEGITGGGGLLRFTLLSSGDTADITVAAASAEATYSVDLPIDPGEDYDTIILSVRDNSTASTSFNTPVYSVNIYTMPIPSPLDAGVMSSGFVPIDDTTTTSGQPLTSYHRTQQLENIDALYKTRVGGTVVSYSENYDERDLNAWLYRLDDASYQLIAELPVWSIPEHCDRLGVTVQGWSSAGSGGKLKIVSQTGNEFESAAFSTGWTYANANTAKMATTANALTVAGGTTDNLKIYLKSDGTNFTALAGLTIWLEDSHE